MDFFVEKMMLRYSKIRASGRACFSGEYERMSRYGEIMSAKCSYEERNKRKQDVFGMMSILATKYLAALDESETEKLLEEYHRN